jgi:soluble lytic murein transglycosylase-like protein
VDFRSERLLDPAYNLDLGVEHLADLIDTLAPDGAPDDDAIALVAAAYNGGLERALAHVRGEPLSKETGRYVARVLQLWHARAQPRR